MKNEVLPYNEELFSTESELLKFKLTLPLAKIDMFSLRFVSNGLNFSDDICINF